MIALAVLAGIVLWANTSHDRVPAWGRVVRLIALIVAAWVVLTWLEGFDLAALTGPEDRTHM